LAENCKFFYPSYGYLAPPLPMFPLDVNCEETRDMGYRKVKIARL